MTSRSLISPTRTILSQRWLRLAQTELDLGLDHQEILQLRDPELKWIIYPFKLLPRVSKLATVRRARTKKAFREVDTLLVRLGFQFARWDTKEGFRVYEKAGYKGKIITVEWAYFEEEEGILRRFKYMEGEKGLGVRGFLRMIVRQRREKR